MKLPNARQRGNDILRNTIGEKFLLDITREIVERQHGDGRLVRQPGRRVHRWWVDGKFRRRPMPYPHRLHNIFQRFLAAVLERHVQSATKLPIGVIRDHDATGIGDFLQTRGNIHAIAKKIAVLDGNIAHVDTNA